MFDQSCISSSDNGYMDVMIASYCESSQSRAGTKLDLSWKVYRYSLVATIYSQADLPDSCIRARPVGRALWLCQ